MRKLLILGLLALSVLAGGLSLARKPEDAYAGKIIVLKKRLPARFPSESGFTAAVGQYKIGTLWPEKTGEGKGKWRLEYIAFFSHPLDDLEVSLRFYDITAGAKRFIQE